MLLYNLEEERKKKNYTKETYYTPITNKFMRESNLTLQEKAFYIYLCGFGDKCFQNQATICKELGVTRPTLRKLMIIHVIPLDKNDESRPSQHIDSILDYLKRTYPSDY